MQEYGFALQGPFSVDTKDSSVLQQISVYDIALQVMTLKPYVWHNSCNIITCSIITYCIKSSITVVNQVEMDNVQ